MGFSRSLNAILAHLPKSRQTLLFSATQTQSVKDLARLSLKTPVSVGAEEKEKEVEGYSATPINLEQHYSVVELDKKLDVLFSFVRTHLKSKILVFLSSCKQVSTLRLFFVALLRRSCSIVMLMDACLLSNALYR
jgi:ATP-dependent RNA helicase DDX10/DBP4